MKPGSGYKGANFPQNTPNAVLDWSSCEKSSQQRPEAPLACLQVLEQRSAAEILLAHCAAGRQLEGLQGRGLNYFLGLSLNILQSS